MNYKGRRQFCKDMKEIYTAPNEEWGLAALDRFEEKWGGKYAYAVKSWRNNWPCLSMFFKYPSEIRRLIYTTNPIESFNSTLRKITRTKTSFPTDDSLFKILYLAVMDTSEDWKIEAVRKEVTAWQDSRTTKTPKSTGNSPPRTQE